MKLLIGVTVSVMTSIVHSGKENKRGKTMSERTCKWKYLVRSKLWEDGCGEKEDRLHDERPDYNGFWNFCPYCGKEIEVNDA